MEDQMEVYFSGAASISVAVYHDFLCGSDPFFFIIII